MPEVVHYFPRSFKWGTSTAAHQVEGNNTNSQWSAWEKQDGRIVNGDRSGQACEWWRNAEADFDRMLEIGNNAHRMSIEWSRIEPREGQFDEAAIERYRAMLLALRRRGIEPMVTLHHFTNPIWFEEQRGWERADFAVPRFERFVRTAVSALGEFCDMWCTINEPNIYAVLGYGDGAIHPPADTNAPVGSARAMNVMRNLLMAHAAAYQAIHQIQPIARVGIAHHMRALQPLRNHALDGAIARMQDAAFNQSVLDALIHGRWNVVLRRGASFGASKLRGTLDWIGLNYYTRQRTLFDRHARESLYGRVVNTPGAQMSDFDYGEIYPEGLWTMLRRIEKEKVRAKIKLPIYITENGTPDADDDHRPAFILRHLRVLWLAVQFCYDVYGYYHWSLVDNFEWAEGWRMKFGLFALDRDTQQRTPRRSAMLYRDIARSSSVTADHAREYAPEVLPILFPGIN